MIKNNYTYVKGGGIMFKRADGMTNEQYIEHEVKIRVLNEQFRMHEKNIDDRFSLNEKHIDDRFNVVNNRLDRVDEKLNWMVGLIITAILLPVVLHLFKLI